MAIRTLVLLALVASTPVHAKPNTAPRPYALAVSASLEAGLVSMERFDQGVSLYLQELQDINPDIRVESVPRRRVLKAFAARLRLYLPRSTFVESGVGLLVDCGSMGMSIDGLAGELRFTNSAIEIPVLLGAHRAIGADWGVYGAIGPTLLLRSRSSWTFDLGQISSFASSRGGGAEALVGANWQFLEWMSMDLVVRYRSVTSGALSLHSQRLPPVQDLGKLDYSGFGLSLGARWRSF